MVSERVIYTFRGSQNGGPDGCWPETNLVRGQGGVFYGTTDEGGSTEGGSTGNGTIYSLTPPAVAGDVWTEAVLYSFTGFVDGSAPAVNLVMGPGGILYGAAEAGGDGGNGTIFNEYGTIFSFTPPVQAGGSWTFNVLHTFEGHDGISPTSLALHNGVLYGAAVGGGLPNVYNPSAGNGVILGIAP